MDPVSLPPEPPAPTAEQRRAETEAMLRISNAIAAQLENIHDKHWRDALTSLARGLREGAERRGYRPSLTRVAPKSP